MADSSLDDFFAKKDKSRKKGKSKFTAIDLTAKQSEEPKMITDHAIAEVIKKGKKEEKIPAVSPAEGGGTDQPVDESDKGFAVQDDEWREYKEEAETDYSGLRIQNLQINQEKGEEEEKEYTTQDGDEDGGNRESSESSQGPWRGKVRESAQPVVAAPAPVKEVEPPKPKEEASTAPKKYIPPGARQAALNPVAHPRRKKQMPNLQSEEDFPTLGGGPPPEAAWGPRGARFEKVRSGGRQAEDPSNRSVQLQLGNKFDALQSGAD